MHVRQTFWMSTITLVVGGGAFAIDLAIANVSRVQLQTALDAATLSGVQALDGTDEGIVDATTLTLDYAYRNTVLQVPLFLEESEIEVGTWDAATQTFHPWLSGHPEAVDAVRARHTSAPLGLTFAAFAPTAHWFDVDAESIAFRASGEVSP